MRCVGYYVVCPSISQLTQPASSTKKNEESPKNVPHQKQTEFAISRNTKVWGRRRAHSTVFTRIVFICSTTVKYRKGSSKFYIGDVEFRGSAIKNQFKLLHRDIEQMNKARNLTAILSNKNFLIGCYLNIKSKPGNITSGLDKQTLDGIHMKSFDEVCNSFRNRSYRFKPSRRIYIPKSTGKLRHLTMPSPRDKVV